MIVKNEAANLARCLAAAADHIDCFVICDTGSTDNTVAFIREFFAARGIPGEIPVTEFRNFEQARNAALDAARASPLQFDYLLLCDADMELVVRRPGFREELTAPAYMVTQQHTDGQLAYGNLRLLRRDLAARYRGVTHEYLDVEPRLVAAFDGIYFLDHASGANRTTKFQRDIALLTDGLREEPGNARYVFYLANSYFDLGDAQNALVQYSKRMRMGGWEEEVFYSQYRYALCLRQQGRAAEMVGALLAAHRQFPHRAEPLHVLAMHHQARQQHAQAYRCAELGAKIPQPASGLFVEPEVYRWRLLDIMAVSAFHLKRFAESRDLNRRLLDLVPPEHRERAFSNLQASVRAAGRAAI